MYNTVYGVQIAKFEVRARFIRPNEEMKAKKKRWISSKLKSSTRQETQKSDGCSYHSAIHIRGITMLRSRVVTLCIYVARSST